MYRDSGNNLLGIRFALLIVILAAPDVHANADEARDSKQVQRDANGTFESLLRQYCFECHGSEIQEANLRFDQLNLASRHPRIGETLDKIRNVVQIRKMPPEEAGVPKPLERTVMVSWLEDRLSKLAHETRRLGHWTRNRRLTVEEYNYTMQALFGVDAEFADLLPADPIAETGYRNDSGRLALSSLQMEAYLDSARRAVERYVQFGKMDRQPLRYQIEFEDLYYSTAKRYETRKRAPAPVTPETFAARRTAKRKTATEYVDPLGPMLPGAFSEEESMRAAIPKLNQQFVAIPKRLSIGEWIVRVRAAGTADRDGRFPRMRVEAGITLGDGCSMNKRILGETDVSALLKDPKTYEFRIRLENVPTKGELRDEDAFDRLSLFDMDQVFISNISSDRKAIFALGRGGYSDPATGSQRIAGDLKKMSDDRVPFLHLDSLELEMLPGVGVENKAYRWVVPMDKAHGGREAELAVARKHLRRFMRHAYRRPVNESEIATKLKLFNIFREREDTFEESLKETLAAVLVSPSFLFLESNLPVDEARKSELTTHQLAARLSYFLWLSPPDDELMERANNGSLAQQSVFRGEAERLLADPRSRRFLKSFCCQWLRLDKHANIAVNRQVYPKYDHDLGELSIRETLAYFVDVVENDSSALDLIDSNYAILNDRLADHYNISKVTVGQLHKVQLSEKSIRGGLLTQASLMTMNSDGLESHPIRRGVWLLDRILNSPPPPPPPNVPEIDKNDPVFQGLSLKEQIVLHRQRQGCQSCHEKIDPWGIPFENFDATGRWRDQVEIEPKHGNFQPQPVDATARLPGGQQIHGIVELKKYIRHHRADQFANSLVHHMFTFAMGRPPDYADGAQVQELQKRFAVSQFRMKELVLAIVESQVFRES